MILEHGLPGLDKISFHEMIFSMDALSNLLFFFETPLIGTPLFYFLIGFGLFLIGFYGLMFLRTNLISLLLAVELMLLGLSLCFIIIFIQLPFMDAGFLVGQVKEPVGLLLAFFFLTLAAAESAIGLALIILVFQQFYNVNVSNFRFLRG